MNSRLPKMPLLLRLYRAGLVGLVLLLIHQQSRWFEARHPSSVSLRQARKFFPAANRIQLRDPERGFYFVTDARNDVVGCMLTTSPQTDNIIGYSGPNNLLIALNSRGVIVGIELLRSGDTKEHVERVTHDPGFLRSFIGWKPGEAPPKVEGVSGATLTSFAIAESIQQRLAPLVWRRTSLASESWTRPIVCWATRCAPHRKQTMSPAIAGRPTALSLSRPTAGPCWGCG